MKYVYFAFGYVAVIPFLSLVVRLLRAPSDLAFYTGTLLWLVMAAYVLVLSAYVVRSVAKDLNE